MDSQKGTARIHGFASAHVKVMRHDGKIEYRRSVQRPHPWWNLRLWILWICKHMEYNKMEKNDG